MYYFIVRCVRCEHAKSQRVIKSKTIAGAIRRASAQCTCHYPKDEPKQEEKKE